MPKKNESMEDFIKTLQEYVEYYNNKEQIKRRESGATPDSLANFVNKGTVQLFLGSSSILK